jgi:hypothetical protein
VTMWKSTYCAAGLEYALLIPWSASSRRRFDLLRLIDDDGESLRSRWTPDAISDSLSMDWITLSGPWASDATLSHRKTLCGLDLK